MRAIALGLAASLVAASANAAVYLGSRTIGTATVELSITTDDTLGVLTEDNILDWTVTVTNGAETIALNGPASGDDSKVDIGGNALTATARGLFFDFSAPGTNYFLFVNPFRQSYCAQTNGCFDFGGGKESAVAGQFVTNFALAPRSGQQQLAAVAVPEPAAWGLMLLGFTGLGAALRTRRRVRAA